MSPGLSGQPTAPEFDNQAVRPSKGGWVVILVTLAVGALSLALAFNEDFAADKAVFADDAYRYVLGGMGAVLAGLAVRGSIRLLSGDTVIYNEQTHRRAKMIGRLMGPIGLVLFLAAVVAPIGDETVSFRDWTKPVYIVAGLLLMPFGLIQMWNPTKANRRHRVVAGEGRSGTAKILRANDTGNLVQSKPEVEIDLEISVGGSPPYAASTKTIMDQAKLALLIPGSTVAVTVDEIDASVFEIDWDRWEAPA